MLTFSLENSCSYQWKFIFKYGGKTEENSPLGLIFLITGWVFKPHLVMLIICHKNLISSNCSRQFIAHEFLIFHSICCCHFDILKISAPVMKQLRDPNNSLGTSFNHRACKVIDFIKQKAAYDFKLCLAFQITYQ